ncbi:hypothetical protein U713_12670 [Rhodobacter capsulatus YW2]|nr:hypothetical protein U713_12670 [Rhodobacter capsulatus YW2]
MERFGRLAPTNTMTARHSTEITGQTTLVWAEMHAGEKIPNLDFALRRFDPHHGQDALPG